MKTYIDILQKHFEKKKEKNPRFSLRAFSIQAGLRPSRMSDMFNGRYGLSLEVAKTITERLKLSGAEAEAFLLSVKKHHSRDISSREKAHQELVEKQRQKPDVEISVENFKNIKEWYNFSILQLLKQKPGLSVQKLAQKLGVDDEKISAAVTALKQLRLISNKGTPLPNKKNSRQC